MYSYKRFAGCLCLVSILVAFPYSTYAQNRTSPRVVSSGTKTPQSSDQSPTKNETERYKLSLQRIKTIEDIIDNYEVEGLSEEETVQRIYAEIERKMPLVPTDPLIKDDDASIRKQAQKKVEKEHGASSMIASKIEAEAEKKYPLYKIGDPIVLDYYAGSKHYSVKGKLIRITNKSVTIDDKMVNLMELSEDDLAKFDKTKNQAARSRYIRNRTSVENQNRNSLEQEAIIQLKKDYVQRNEKAGYIYDLKNKKWLAAQDVAKQNVGTLLVMNKLLNDAKNGNPQAQFEVAECYYNGKNTKKSVSDAFTWYRKAAEQGNVEAQLILADCLYNGRDVSIDYSEAFHWYLKAAEQGRREAQYMAGECYFLQRGVDKSNRRENETEAIKWFEKSASAYRIDAEKGNALAQYRVGKFYYVKYDYLCSHSGSDKVLIDQTYNEYLKWYQLAAKQGVADAQYEIGYNLCCLDDRDYLSLMVLGVSFKESEGITWIRKAAKQGHARAQAYLGLALLEGEGVKRNEKEAFKWLQMAAEQGEDDAQCDLANCYRHGYGVKKDLDEAIKWYKKSAEQGNSDAKKALEQLGY